MTSNSYDVIVAGVGAMGSAACRHLTKRGLKVLGLKRFAGQAAFDLKPFSLDRFAA